MDCATGFVIVSILGFLALFTASAYINRCRALEEQLKAKDKTTFIPPPPPPPEHTLMFPEHGVHMTYTGEVPEQDLKTKIEPILRAEPYKAIRLYESDLGIKVLFEFHAGTQPTKPNAETVTRRAGFLGSDNTP